MLLKPSWIGLATVMTVLTALETLKQFCYPRALIPNLKSTHKRFHFAVAVAVFLLAGAAQLCAQSPWVTTQPAGPGASTTAALNGMATARGNSTVAWFEWGTDTSYGNVTATTNIGIGGQVVRISFGISGLTPGGIYHSRLVASNIVGIVYGMDVLLTTGTRIATWNSSDVPLPVIPLGLSNIVGIACGHGHYLALTTAGTVVAWPVVSYSGAAIAAATVPPGLSNVVVVAGGYSHSLALRQDGGVTAWGTYLANGQTAFVPAGLSNIVAVAGGDSHSMALKNDGTVAAWGNNSQGQTTIPFNLKNVVAIAAGSTHSLALRSDGTVITWGSEPLGQPMTPPTWLSNVVAISSESWHNLALRVDGTVVAWGNNFSGQTNVPPGLTNVVAISAGHLQSLALKADGTLVAWGYTNYVNKLPVALGNVVTISSGDYHSLALSSVNLAPVAFSRTVTGGVNKDLIISLTGWDPNGDPLGFQIIATPTNGALYQYDPDFGRGAVIAGGGTPVTDSSRVVFVPSTDAFGASYTTFGIAASDGDYNSDSALITVMILPSPAIQPIGFASGSNGAFTVGFAGLSNAAYSVQASTNLINWTRLGSASQLFPGQFTFLDTGATNWPSRFYRIVSP